MYEHEKEQIKQLSGAVLAINAKAAADGRSLTREELQLRGELEAKMEYIQRSLPAHEPMTLERRGSGYVARPSGPFNSFGEQLRSVITAGTPGGATDPRLHEVRAATGLSETLPSDGGFLVQKDFSYELLQDVYATGLLASRCRRIQLSGNSNSIQLNAFDETSRASTRFGGVVGYWVDEAALITASRPKFRKIDLKLKKLTGLCYLTSEVMEDYTAMESVVRNAFVSEFAFQLDDGILNGTGAGQMLGLLNSGSLVTVDKESGQTAATIVAENVIKMWSRLLPGSEANAVWLANKNTLPQLLQLSLAVGTGGVPLYMPANSIAGVPYQTLFGRPVIFCEQCATLGTVGDLVLCDLGRGYIIAEKGGIRQDLSIHVQFVFDENVIRSVYRVDGQPTLASALTPYKGTTTQSTHIALATRS